ncbi:MAG: hypothetical protein ACTSRR_10485 [Candidatus Heimdallarchaeaceae archaeon]
MSKILSLKEINNDITIEKMELIINLYEQGTLTKKEASKLAEYLLKKFKAFKPQKEKKEQYEFILDLCISLTTIKRAEENFESYYLKSLKEELVKAKKM